MPDASSVSSHDLPVWVEWIGSYKGPKGDKGAKGDPGTFAAVHSVTIPADEQGYAVMHGPEAAKEVTFYQPRGLPGVNAVPADEFIGTVLAAKDTEAWKGAARSFVPKGVFSIDIADLGAKVDGSALVDGPVQAAINAWSGSFGTLVLTAPPRSVIRTAGLVSAGKPVSLDFENSKLIQTSDAPIFEAFGTWGATVAASAASRTTVTVATSSSFRIGDLVKVFSDDVIQFARVADDGGTARQGEFAYVSEIPDGNTLTIHPPLIDSYSTNIRVAKLNDVPVEVNFGTAENEAGGTGTLFRFKSLLYPKIRGRILKGGGVAVGARSCYGTKADIEVKDLPSNIGYGFSNAGSAYSDVYIHATRVRHAYTDDVSGWLQGTSSDPGDYGRPMFDRIQGHAVATHSSAWDTHHGGYGHKFIGCVSKGVRIDGEAGFNVRGQAHEYHGCTAADGTIGFRIFGETADNWALVEGIRLVGCSTRGAYNAVQIEPPRDLTPAGRGPTATIEGGEFESRGGFPLRVYNARVRFKGNPVFRHTGTSFPASGQAFVSVGVSEMRGKFMIEAMSVTSGSIADIVRFVDLTPSNRKQPVDLEIDYLLNEYVRANTSVLCRVNTMSGGVRQKINGTTTAAAGAGFLLPESEQYVTLHSDATDDVSVHTSQKSQTVAAGDTITVGRSGDPIVLVRLYASGAVTAGGLSKGAFAGQMAVLQNRASSGGVITVPDGGNQNIGGNQAIAVGSALRLFWDAVSGVWIRA